MRRVQAPAPPLLVMHIPKTAGTTLRAVVERQYQRDDLLRLYPDVPRSADRPDRPPAAVMGHFRFGLHACYPAGARYVTLFRDPVDQVVSHYNHLLNSAAPAHREVLGPGDGLDRFLAHEWARNLQTQYLTGLSAAAIEADPFGACRVAADVLARHFVGYGVVEAFDESVRALARRLGWRVPAYTPLNRAADRPVRLMREELPPELVRRVERANACDGWVHRHAARVLAARPVGLLRRLAGRAQRTRTGG